MLFAGLAFPLWNQSILIKAVDLSGMPVSDAVVKIIYQHSDAINTEPDGVLIGKTDDNGTFYANLSNVVPLMYENRDFSVSLSTYYWDGETNQARQIPPIQKQ